MRDTVHALPRNRSAQALRFAFLLALAACTADASGPIPPSDDPALPAGNPGLGAGASLDGRRPFPTDNWWNTDISSQPVDPASATLIAACGLRNLHPDFGTVWNGAPNGIPYIVVAGNQPEVPVFFLYDAESDPGPYPIPGDAPIEGGPLSDGDRHVLVVDRDNWKLYELFDARPIDDGNSWRAGSGAMQPACRSLLAWYATTRPSSGARSGTRCASPAQPHDVPTSNRHVTSPAAGRTPTCRPWVCACASKPITTSPASHPWCRRCYARSKLTACCWQTMAVAGTSAARPTHVGTMRSWAH